MYAIEYFVGSARGRWAVGKRRYPSRDHAEAVVADDWKTEARHYTGIILRRVVLR